MKGFDLVSEFKSDIYVNNDSIHRTKIGGCLTIIIGVVTILCLIGFGKDLFSKKMPIVYSADYIENNTLKINRTLFQAAISPVKTGGIYI